MTMWFGADRVKQLNIQSINDQFVDGFNSMVWQSRTSSYFNNQRYSQILITFLSWSHGMSITLSWSSLSSFSGFSSSVLVLDRMLAWGTLVPSLEVRLIPYAIWCSVYSANQQLSWAILTSYISNQKHCYTLDSSLCVLKKSSCQ